MKKKIIFIVIDGLGDKTIRVLGNKTPLEAAKTSNLDSLTKEGVSGLIKPFLFSSQEKPASDTCHLALFGYDPNKYYLGRGPYEAMGIGIKLKKASNKLMRTIPITISTDLIINSKPEPKRKNKENIKAINRFEAGPAIATSPGPHLPFPRL